MYKRQAAVSADNTRDRIDTFVYDAAGRLLGTTDSMGKSESYTYDGVGNKTGFVNKAGNQWTYEYDAAGRLVIERTPQTLSLIHISRARASRAC